MGKDLRLSEWFLFYVLRICDGITAIPKLALCVTAFIAS